MLKVTCTQEKRTRDYIAVQSSELDTIIDNKQGTLEVKVLDTCETIEQAKQKLSYWQMMLFGDQNQENIIQ